MISAVRGSVFEISPGVVHVDTGSGMILQVLVPVSAYTALKNEKEVLLHTVMRVKDDLMIKLYPFAVKEQYFKCTVAPMRRGTMP